MIRAIIFILVVFGIGAAFGQSLGPGADVEFVEVERTKIVEVTPAPAPTPVAELPKDCQYALKYTHEAATMAEKVFKSGQDQIQIMSDARLALYSGDPNEIIAIQMAQQELHSKTVGYLADMEEALANLELVLPGCEDLE